MINQVFYYLGGSITFVWGVAHLFPTKSIVKGFGNISIDNKHIITMEWIIEGIALMFIGIIVIGVTIVDSTSNVSLFIYFSSILALLILTIVSLYTGYKVNFLPFKLCPFLFSSSAILIFVGYVL